MDAADDGDGVGEGLCTLFRAGCLGAVGGLEAEDLDADGDCGTGFATVVCGCRGFLGDAAGFEVRSSGFLSAHN